MDLPRLKEEIVRKMDVAAFYNQALHKFNIPLEGVKFESNGWSSKVFCPNHNDNRTPNFAFNVHSGAFKCFACDNFAGSVFDFYCFVNGMDRKIHFKQAVEALCEDVGVDIPDWAAITPASTAPVDADKTPKPRRGFKQVNKAEQARKTKAPLAKNIVEGFVKNLNAKNENFKYLASRGLKMNTIEEWHLGWDDVTPQSRYKTPDGEYVQGRYTIPVTDETGEVFWNIRQYGPQAERSLKMLNLKGYGSPPRLFGVHLVKKYNPEYIVFCEGEFDCMLLNQELNRRGLQNLWVAVTGTHGATLFEPEWLEYMFKRHVFICMDVDEAGITAASMICTKFFLEDLKVGRFRSLKIMRLPLDGSKESNDISDYFLKSGATIDDFIRLAMNTPHIEAGGMSEDEATVKAKEVSSLTACLKDRQYVDKRVTVPLTISGQTSRIYHAARSYKIVGCKLMREGSHQASCCSAECKEKLIPYGDDTFILSSMSTKLEVRKAIQRVACTYGEEPQINIEKKVVMEEYFAHQVVPRWRAEENSETGKIENVQELVTIPVYILQPENSVAIRPQNYMATGWVRSHPKTSAATLFIEHLEPMEDDWLSFKASAPGVHDELKKLKAFGWESILEQITNGVTYIYDSDHILMTVLLTYLSPLRFIFNGKIERGWLNCCIMGDSGTGKSKTYMRFSDWLNLGDLFSVLTGRRTGLLYAVKQRGSEWYVQIGRYVMANKKIIAIDETQDMEPSELKKMGIAMDEGILEVAQVSSGCYQTETRLLFLMNPRDRFGNAKTLTDYAYGCQALRDCFDPMFIRRLDLAIFVTGKDNYQFYNQSTAQKKKDVKITADGFKTLIYWAWTRTVNDIHWSAEAEEECFRCAIELSNKFGDSDDIPLAFPTDVRLKIARLATAFAILDCSFTEDMEGVNITPEHVRSVKEFINIVYSDMTCNLSTHSKLAGRRKILVQTEYDKIRINFEKYIKKCMQSQDKTYAQSHFFCQMLLIIQNSGSIKKRDLQDQLGLSERWVREHVNILRMYDLVDFVEGGVRITRKFNKFMQTWRQEKICLDAEREVTVEEMLENVYRKIGENSLRTQDTLDAGNYRRENQNYGQQREYVQSGNRRSEEPAIESPAYSDSDFGTTYNSDEYMPPGDAADPFM